MTSGWRRHLAHLLVAMLGGLALLFAVGWFALSQLSDGLCGNDVLAEVPSPDRRFRLVAFNRDCGATTGFSTQVSLLELNEELPNSAGNVFISNEGKGVASTDDRKPEVRMHWEGPSSVIIEHGVRTRVFLSEGSRDGVRFAYRSFANQ